MAHTKSITGSPPLWVTAVAAFPIFSTVPGSDTITGQSTGNRQGRDRAATLGTAVAAISFLLKHRQGWDRSTSNRCGLMGRAAVPELDTITGQPTENRQGSQRRKLRPVSRKMLTPGRGVFLCGEKILCEARRGVWGDVKAIFSTPGGWCCLSDPRRCAYALHLYALTSKPHW